MNPDTPLSSTMTSQSTISTWGGHPRSWGSPQVNMVDWDVVMEDKEGHMGCTNG